MWSMKTVIICENVLILQSATTFYNSLWHKWYSSTKTQGMQRNKEERNEKQHLITNSEIKLKVFSFTLLLPSSSVFQAKCVPFYVKDSKSVNCLKAQKRTNYDRLETSMQVYWGFLKYKQTPNNYTGAALWLQLFRIKHIDGQCLTWLYQLGNSRKTSINSW